jgi:hypothetical protein
MEGLKCTYDCTLIIRVVGQVNLQGSAFDIDLVKDQTSVTFFWRHDDVWRIQNDTIHS